MGLAERIRPETRQGCEPPGAKLFYEGQLKGKKVTLPVLLGRRRIEPVDQVIMAFYRTLLKTACREELHNGS
jgi:hypothetical protein